MSPDIQKTKLYDVGVALPLIGLCVYQSGRFIAQIILETQFAWRSGVPSAAFAVAVAGHVAVLLFLLLQLVLLVFRTLPKRKSEGMLPRIVAFMGAGITVATPLLPRADISPTMELMSVILILLGGWGSVYSLSWLGKSFSVMPEARALVVHGPYRLIRHPLYASEIVMMLGVILQFQQPYALLGMIAFVSLQLARIQYEERVLTATFSPYTGYAQKTARLIPGVY